MNAIFSHCKNRKNVKTEVIKPLLLSITFHLHNLQVWYISFISVNFYEPFYRKHLKQNFTFIISSKEFEKIAVLIKEKISSAFNIQLRGLRNYVTCYSCTYTIELGG